MSYLYIDKLTGKRICDRRYSYRVSKSWKIWDQWLSERVPASFFSFQLFRYLAFIRRTELRNLCFSNFEVVENW